MSNYDSTLLLLYYTTVPIVTTISIVTLVTTVYCNICHYCHNYYGSVLFVPKNSYTNNFQLKVV